MNLRYGNNSDAALFSEIGARTFFDSYAEDLDAERLDSYIRAAFSTEILLKEISDPNAVFLIGAVDGKSAGYARLLINSSNEYINRTRPLEISRIYLLREYIGKGHGRELMTSVLEEAKQRGCDVVWLGVWKKNQRAINFYKKLGFREAGSQAFRFGTELQTDLIMELELN